MTQKPPCEHFADLPPVAPDANRCEACAALGATWHQLRICLVCGHVGCCEDSEHAHALAHFRSTGHPVIASFEPGETWGWCYVHQRYADPMPASLPKRRTGVAGLVRRLFGR